MTNNKESNTKVTETTEGQNNTKLTLEQVEKLLSLPDNYEFKNYKELCKFIDETPKVSNSRKRHINLISDVVDIEQNGHKLTIFQKESDEQNIEELLRNLNLQTRGRKNIHGDRINKLVIHEGQKEFKRSKLLSEDTTVMYNENDEETMRIIEKDEFSNNVVVSYRIAYVTPLMMMVHLNLVNDDYKRMIYNTKQVSRNLGVDIKNVKEFFNTTYNNFTKIIERSFESLYKRRLMRYTPVIMIVKENGKQYIPELAGIYGQTTHEEANNSQYQLVLDSENEVLTEMGYKSVQDVILRNKYREFKELSLSKLEDTDIKNYYKSYKLMFASSINKEKKMNNKEIKIIQDEVNKVMQKQIETNAKKRQKDLISKRYIGEPNKQDNIYLNNRLQDDYIDEMNILIEKFIAQRGGSIANTIIEEK